MKILVLSSGGVDSTTCLALAVEEVGAENVLALYVYYGQKHDKEIQAAKKVAEYYGVRRMELDLSVIFAGSNCSLLKQSTEDIPLESYAQQIEETHGEKPVSTYVPFRNGLFLSSAASIALSHGCSKIMYGALDFVNAMNQAIYLGSGNQLTIEAPFVSLTKADVVKKGLELGVPYALTWSCYEGGEKPCGKCGTCIDRQKAFEKNGVIDPLLK